MGLEKPTVPTNPRSSVDDEINLMGLEEGRNRLIIGSVLGVLGEGRCVSNTGFGVAEVASE